jgi:hypothetical protein
LADPGRDGTRVMTTVDELLDHIVPKREPKRNQYGIPHPDTGEETWWQRATTLARMLADTYLLNQWEVRMTAKGLTMRPDLYAQVAAATLDEKSLINAVCTEAKEAAGSTVGRNAGSALHRFAERADAGEQITVPPPYDRDIIAYRTELARLQITPVANMSERIIVVPDLGVAGTFDRHLEAPSWPLPRVGDLKTAQSIFGWLEIAIQLAIYARGSTIWDLDLERHLPMPAVDQDVAIVMHVPAGGGACTIYEVDIAAGWHYAQLAVAISDATVTTDAPDDGGLRAEHARQRLIVLAERKAAVTWPTGVQTFKEQRLSQHIYTHHELLAIEAALSEAEKAVEAPFPPDEPACDAARLAVMIARLEQIPSDLFTQAVEASKKHLIPNLRTGKVSVRHLQLLEDIVTPLEAEAAQRTGAARNLLGEYGDDPNIGRTILALAGCTDLAAVDDSTAVFVTAIVEALDDDVLTVHIADDGTETLTPGQKVEELVLAFGGDGRAAAVNRIREVADAHGLKRPRSFAVAVADPLLCALIAHAAKQPV